MYSVKVHVEDGSINDCLASGGSTNPVIIAAMGSVQVATSTQSE